MDMSSMDGMGMDSSSDPMFRTYNQVLARGYWYIVAFVLAVILVVRMVDFYQTWSRIRLHRARPSIKYPTKVTNFPMQCFATVTAIGREIGYPQVRLHRWLSGLNPPPLGRVLIIICYWVIIVYMMTSTAVIDDAYYWERIGFRNAWISVTQVPLMYLLASKSSIIGHIIGSSHERLNWLHRWVSRTLLVTVTVHGYFFMAEWTRADFVTLELQMMPMVKYGLGAWGVLVWTFLSSLAPLRRVAYEFFVLQHIAGSGVFLWLLWVHVPAYAQYNIWFAIAAISFDWIFRGILLLYRNFRIRNIRSCNGTQRVGHQVELQAEGSDLTILTIKDVHLSWKAGQHIYLWVPALGPLESHPFTIATSYKPARGCPCNEIQLVIRAHSGFSKRVHTQARKMQSTPKKHLTCFITGPYGAPANWRSFESLVLISASTGASFTLPILEYILSTSKAICTQRISFLLITKYRAHVQYYEQRLSEALVKAENKGIELEVQIAVTGEGLSLHRSENEGVEPSTNSLLSDHEELVPGLDEKTGAPYVAVKSHTPTASISSQNEIQLLGNYSCDKERSSQNSCCQGGSNPGAIQNQIAYKSCRPDIATFIRKTVEITGGETSVVVCGGKPLVAKVRNSVASLSDERAVHKGTGAQGIHLYVEEYCF